MTLLPNRQSSPIPRRCYTPQQQPHLLVIIKHQGEEIFSFTSGETEAQLDPMPCVGANISPPVSWARSFVPKAGIIKVRLRVKSPRYSFEIHVLGLLQTQRHTTSADGARESEFPSSSPANNDNCHGSPPSAHPLCACHMNL